MLKIDVTGFRGITQAQFDAPKITLLTGRNAVGKSSVLAALAAVLSGDTMPVSGMDKKGSGAAYVNRRASTAKVSITKDDGAITCSWPEMKIRSDGEQFVCDAHAAGVVRFSSLISSRERAGFLGEYIKANPTKEDLEKNLIGAGFEQKFVDTLWNDIELNRDWDVMYNTWTEQGRAAKNRWQTIAGEAYGSKKAESWLPKGADHSIIGASQQEADQAVKDAEAALEKAIAAKAVSADVVDRYETLAKKVPDLKISISNIEKVVEALKLNIDALETERNSIPTSKLPTNSGACPHCGLAIAFEKSASGYAVSKTVEVSPDELGLRQAAITVCNDKIADARAEMNLQIKNQRNLSAAYREAKGAEDQLAEIRAKGSTGGEGDVDAARLAKDIAVEFAKNIRKKNEADTFHRDVQIIALIVKALAPDGVRAWKMQIALEDFNSALANASTVAGWGKVSVNSEMLMHFETIYGDLPYFALSTSEKMRADLVMQITLAAYSKAEIVLMDGVEILDNANGRRGLFRLLNNARHSTIVGMTTNNLEKDPPPDLAALKLGQTFWVQDGTVSSYP
ncbi:MAG: AAA family ATPase [Magnetococcales bacterium]|nr:AAA family ATPase [Magnetococcales bacterium]